MKIMVEGSNDESIKNAYMNLISAFPLMRTVKNTSELRSLYQSLQQRVHTSMSRGVGGLEDVDKMLSKRINTLS